MDYIGENLIVSANNGDMIFWGNESLALILNCIKNKMSHEQIVNEMCKKYDVSRGEVERDLIKVYSVCLDNGLIIQQEKGV